MYGDNNDNEIGDKLGFEIGVDASNGEQVIFSPKVDSEVGTDSRPVRRKSYYIE